MSVVWDGLPGKTASHLFVLPTQTKSILALPTHTVLLREDGVVLLHSADEGVSPLETDPTLPSIRSLSPYHPKIDEEAERNVFLCLAEIGSVYKVSLDGFVTVELIKYTATTLKHGLQLFPQPGFNNNNNTTTNQISESPLAGTSAEPDTECSIAGLDPDIVHLVDRTQHQICSSRTGQVWSRGALPRNGLVHATNKFEKVAFFAGKQILQLEGGKDFSVCLLRTDPDAVLSPEDGDSPLTGAAELDTTDGETTCPLGLNLQHQLDQNTNFTSSNLASHRTDDGLLPSGLDPPKELRLSAKSEVSTESDPLNSRALVPDSGPKASQPLLSPIPSNTATLDRLAEVCKSNSEPPNLTPTPPSSPSSVHKSQSMDDFDLVDITPPLQAITLNHKSRRSFSAFYPRRPNMLSSQGDNLRALVKEGAELRATEVWVWGAGQRGQLGQGDMLSRPSPATIPLLLLQHIVKISAGCQHALALTASGQLYGWGNNKAGQANPNESLAVVLQPTRIRLPSGETVRDMVAGENRSWIISDTGAIYYTGIKGSSKTRLHAVKLEGLEIPKIVQMDSVHHTLQPVSLAASNRLILVNFKPVSRYTCGVIWREKQLLDQLESMGLLLNLLNANSSPRSSSNSPRPASPPPAAIVDLLPAVADSLTTAKSLLSVCAERSRHKSSHEDYSKTGLYRYISAWREACTALCWTVGNCISMDALLLDSHQTQHQHIIVDILLDKFNFHQQSIRGQLELEQLLLETYKLSLNYIKSLIELHTKAEDGKLLLEKISDLMALHGAMEKQRQEAEDTRSFWKTAGSKLEDFKIPSRRLVMDNRTHPLFLLGAHMSRHWIVLLSDVLVDVGYSVNVYQLSAIWIDSPLASGSGRYEIVLTMPEETVTLYTSTPTDRNYWVKGLLGAIAGCVRKGSEVAAHPPITRSVEYEFKRGELKGASFKGSMTQARMYGKGSMVFANKSRYTGGWKNGIQHGWGILTNPDGSTQEGTWKGGKLTGEGKLQYPDSTTLYEGGVLDGQPHGHGIMKEGTFMNRGASVYTGEWERGIRHGYGVLDDITTGEKYMGMWMAGVRHGAGCVVNGDGIYYEGKFVSNKLTGGGTMIFEDGAVYEGEFQGAGRFSGKGVLLTKTDKFDGVFHGNYADGMKFNGTVTRNSEALTPTAAIGLPGKIQRSTVRTGRKWKSIYAKFAGLLEAGSNPWEQLAIALNKGKVTARESGKQPPKEIDYLEMIPHFGQSGEMSWSVYHNILEYLKVASACPVHPLSSLVRSLDQAFNMSYGGVRSHPTLLPHAKDELDTICERLYGFATRLFPALPAPAAQAWISDPEKESVLVTPRSLFFPVLLPPIYPTLFHLYIQQEEKLDKEYRARLVRWNKHSDSVLLTFFDVDISVWDLPTHRRNRDELFKEAVYALQRLKTIFIPHEKLEVVVSMFKAIMQQTGTGNVTWSMDALLPVCMFVVVRARVLQLGAELAMLADFMETYLFQGEQGIMFTTLQAAYTQILRENIFIN